MTFVLCVTLVLVPILDNMNNMNNNNNSLSIFNLIADMADARRAYAKEHGFEATEEEIADHIKSSLINMMKEGK